MVPAVNTRPALPSRVSSAPACTVVDLPNYQLVDFGNGRKLERFDPFLIDRPSPAAEGHGRVDPDAWRQATARFERRGSKKKGSWNPKTALPATWKFSLGTFQLELKPTDFGHLGVFVEQAPNWNWIGRRIRATDRSPKVLNLFAYTGASTLAAAAAGAEVVHVDAARNVIAWARRNAEHSELTAAPIRWICEDALKFVDRELRRGHQYDAIILDPPSYGRGPKGETWKLTTDLLPLLHACGQLTAKRRDFVVLTCHSPGFGPAELEACLADAMFGHCQAGGSARHLYLSTTDGRKLNAGVSVRWPG